MMNPKTIYDPESRARAREKSIDTRHGNQALEAAISSAELYLQALRMCDDVTERKRLDAKTRQLLARAEQIKAMQLTLDKQSLEYPRSTRTLTTREKIILLEGAKLNGSIFKPWSERPEDEVFELRSGEGFYIDEPSLPLSKAQQLSLAGWERPREAFARIHLTRDGQQLPNEPVMSADSTLDLVQDMASDCSVVASLCAGSARVERGHQQLLDGILFPFDPVARRPIQSANGRYVVCLYFNGCWRRVDIDDRLPSSKSNRLLHVIDRAHPGLLWPALLEKAYLKVRGGYDFPGSNSGTDVAVLTSWIPQQVFLHDEDVEPDQLWIELLRAHQRGDVLLTIGTGKLARKEQAHFGLAPEHDYAILDIKDSETSRQMLIKNPWSNGSIWKGGLGASTDEDDNISSPGSGNSDRLLPGTFWMTYDQIFQHFENLYANWNPAIFSVRQDIHFSWHTSREVPVPNVFVDNPQFAVSTTNEMEIWILLNRHFRTGDYTNSTIGNNGFISIYLYDTRNGGKVLSTEGALIRGPFVDSPNTLIRFRATPNCSYTAVVLSQGLPSGQHNFTLSVFASAAFMLTPAPSAYPRFLEIQGSWNRNTAGGNSDSPRYLENPQYSITIAVPTTVAVVLRISDNQSLPLDQTNIHVKVLLLHSPASRQSSEARAHRIIQLRTRDIVASSNDYRRGSAVIETTLAEGAYVLICSTFVESQFARFSVDLHHSAPPDKLTFVPIPAENSGRFDISIPTLELQTTSRSYKIQLFPPSVTRAVFIANVAPSSIDLLFKMSLQTNLGPFPTIIATSETDTIEYASNRARINDIRLAPPTAQDQGLWLVVDRPEQAAASMETMALTLNIDIVAEERVVVGPWQAIAH